jgi:protease YdgD
MKKAQAGLLLCAIWATAPALGQDGHPGIIGSDDRQIVQQEGPPWDAVGQVNISLYNRLGRCTGTLVKPDLVITAAHCVIDPWKKAPFPLHAIHFVAGIHANSRKGHSTAKCLRFLKDFIYVGPDRVLPRAPAQKVPIEALTRDVVAIVLQSEIAVEPAALARAAIGQPGHKLTHAAFPADRRYQLTAHFGCRLLRADLFGPLWFNDCDTHPASSGGPIFVDEGGKLKLAAIMLGGGDRISNLALPVSEWMSLTESATCS